MDLAPPGLHRAGDLLSEVFEGSADGLLLAQGDRVLRANRALLALLGRSEEQVVGSHLGDLGLWGDPAEEAGFRRMLDEGGRAEAVTSLTDGSGRSRSVSLSAETVGVGVDPLLFLRAVDGRQGDASIGVPAGAGWRASVQLPALVENIPAVTYAQVADPTSPTGVRDVYVSPQARELLGREPAEFLADPLLWERIVHPEDIASLREAERRALEAGEPLSSELRVIRPDGRVRWFRIDAVHVMDPASGLHLIQGMLSDVTRREQAEQQRRQAEARYRTLVETIPAVVFIDLANDQSTNLFTSPQTTAILGYTPEDWAAIPDLWHRIIHPDDFDRVMEANDRHRGVGSMFDQTYRVVTKDGRTIWVRDVAVLEGDEFGNPTSSFGFLFDITSQKEAEEALRVALEREGVASERLRAMNKDLRSMDRLKDTVLRAVSHDLKEPLAAIYAGLMTLAQRGTDIDQDERSAMLDGMARRAHRMNSMLTNLLDLDRLTGGEGELQRMPVEIHSSVAGALEALDPDVRARIQVEVPQITAFVDGPQVERIVENLLSNAVRHTPAGTRIWIRAERTPDGVLLSVEDEGRGVPDELKDAIFLPFERGAVDPGVTGVGIGLSLVARFAEAHRGRAWVDDRPGGGAAFRVLLPEG